MNDFGKFYLATVEMCEPPRKVTSSKSTFYMYSTYQNLYNRAKAIIKKDAAMAFYEKKELLYL